MKNFCIILSLLGMYLRFTQSANYGGISAITWANSLKTEAEVTAYLTSTHEMASEMLALDVTVPETPVVKMGSDAAGAFTLDACLKLFKDKRKSQELFLEVPSIDAYKAAAKVVLDASNGDAKTFVILNMRIFKGPNDLEEPVITPKMMKEHMSDGIRKSFALTNKDGNKKGYTGEIVTSISNGWTEGGFTTANGLFFELDVVHIAYTEPNVLEVIESLLALVPKRVYYLESGTLDKNHMAAFRMFISVTRDNSYFNVPDEFRKELFAEQPTAEPTTGTDDNPTVTGDPETVPTVPSGGRVLVPMCMIIEVLAIAGVKWIPNKN